MKQVTTDTPIRLFPDGDQWCALFGDNLQDGYAGFGETPEEAIADLFEQYNLTETTNIWRLDP
jgi:hypothetical protein